MELVQVTHPYMVVSKLLVITPVVVVVVMPIMIEHMFIRLVILELVLEFINIYPQIIQQRYLQTIISLEL